MRLVNMSAFCNIDELESVTSRKIYHLKAGSRIFSFF